MAKKASIGKRAPARFRSPWPGERFAGHSRGVLTILVAAFLRRKNKRDEQDFGRLCAIFMRVTFLLQPF
ncbi:hypothetical protein SAMN03159496_01385 [Rhizobium sp. NFR07]|uniref:hypothetical protein n=1 Tax=Rhizobium sp. NFR07 TaxID=1566262 RepID=UPI0008E9502D|nr:hypothetical protein [Rhizobium sp. NFR07]SFB02904.1 hypothetical protein SAMN03159496_01385 [Rhizobium sp. NFR07]